MRNVQDSNKISSFVVNDGAGVIDQSEPILDLNALLQYSEPNDYLLPTISYGNQRVYSYNDISGSGTGLSSWDICNFPSGMTSASEFDVMNDGSQTPFSIKNIMNNVNHFSTNNNNRLGAQLDSNMLSQASRDIVEIENYIYQLGSTVGKIDNYEEDSRMAVVKGSAAINILLTGSEPDAVKAMYMLYIMSKKENLKYILCSLKDLPTAMIVVLERFRNQALIRHCTSCINVLMSNEAFAVNFKNESAAVKTLSMILRHANGASTFLVVAILHTLVVKFPEVKNELLNNSIFEILLNLFRFKNQKFNTLLVDVLHFLSRSNPQIIGIMQNTSLIAELYRILCSSNFEKLTYTVCRYLKTLSTIDSIKQPLISSGLVKILTSLLLNKSRRIAFCSLYTLRNLSDLLCTEDEATDLINICVRFLSSQVMEAKKLRNEHGDGQCYIQEQDLASCAAGVLANLMCNHKKNKETFVSSGGSDAVSFMLLLAFSEKQLIEPALYCLKHSTINNQGAKTSINSVRSVGGFDVLGQLLDYHSAQDEHAIFIKRAIIGICHNMATFLDNMVDCLNYKIPQRMCNTIKVTVEMMNKLIEEANVLTNLPGKENEVYLITKTLNNFEKLTEEAVILLLVITSTLSKFTHEEFKNNYIKSYIDYSVLDLFVLLLSMRNASIVNCVVNILGLLSKTQIGINEIYMAYFGNISPMSVYEYNNVPLLKVLLNLIDSYDRSSVPVKNVLTLLGIWSQKIGGNLQYYLENVLKQKSRKILLNEQFENEMKAEAQSSHNTPRKPSQQSPLQNNFVPNMFFDNNDFRPPN